MISYLGGYRWARLTRDERFYCFELYRHAIADPADFAKFVIDKAQLDCERRGPWDLGVEVCLYRDYRWHHGLPVKHTKFSQKRTFDLCLFGSSDMIIIEAKVDQTFDGKQMKSFLKDKTRAPDLLGRKDLAVSLVALASSTYLDRQRARGGGVVKRVFDGHAISWNDMFGKYQDEVLSQADNLYRSKARLLA